MNPVLPFGGVGRVEDLKEQDKAEGPGIPAQFRVSMEFSPQIITLGTERCISCGKRQFPGNKSGFLDHCWTQRVASKRNLLGWGQG